MKTPSYKGRSPASKRSSAAARGASRKEGTIPELRLRRALWHSGFRCRTCVDDLPGKPDIVFVGPRLAVFCEGDFWHGRDWPARRAKLEKGHNPGYWVAKIERNMERDREAEALLRAAGWRVLRVWESEIRRDLGGVVTRVREAISGGDVFPKATLQHE